VIARSRDHAACPSDEFKNSNSEVHSIALAGEMSNPVDSANKKRMEVRKWRQANSRLESWTCRQRL
jgi:hypothetical protein